MRNIKKWIQIVAFVSVLLPVRAQMPPDRDEGLAHALGPEWKVRYQVYAGHSNLLEFVHGAEKINNWTELVTLQDFNDTLKFSPEEILNKLKVQREKECPGVTQWNVIGQDERSLLYEWHVGHCRNWPEQVEIARIILGKHSWYLIHYAAKVHELASSTRTQWIKTFSDATFDSVTSSFDPTLISVDVDELVPFDVDRVAIALKPAMESQNCNVTEASANRIECKRPRVATTSKHMGSGGESVTAMLEANGGQTQVRITTGKGFNGRLLKQNWSTPIYVEMMKTLQKAQP